MLDQNIPKIFCLNLKNRTTWEDVVQDGFGTFYTSSNFDTTDAVGVSTCTDTIRVLYGRICYIEVCQTMVPPEMLLKETREFFRGDVGVTRDTVGECGQLVMSRFAWLRLTVILF